MPQILAAGAMAPDFELHVTPDQKLSLRELRGRPVILAFYPADWSPVCGDQMALYNQILPEFRTHDAELLGISVDGVWCHDAFAKDRHLHFPLLADFEPKGAVSKKYGAYRDADGCCERAVRARRTGADRLELLLSGRGESRRRWDTQCPGKTFQMKERLMLAIPVGAADHVQGNNEAAITLVEYGDYECPHCGHAYPIIKRVQRHFGSKLRFVFRNFPLSEIHPYAQAAAEAAEFAASLGKFWEMHDAIFENQTRLSQEMLLELAESLGLPGEKLGHALARGAFTEHVKRDFIGGVRSGVNGTPTFFINGQRHDAAFEFEDLVAAIEMQGMVST